ncbi:DUF2059 domain-containing protein [Shewanella waksmanii]|uniref:DUF2059 domain-containing protein n=1 Tax=Shewanella waksmanii TaxID=213783 RepID=UPI0004B0D224|nr:DUF2059 domain-containing protein [Shewanella waksmanii]
MYLRRLSILVLLCCAASTLTQASPRLNAQQLSAAASSHQAAAKALLQATYAEDVIDQALYQLKSSYAHMLKDMPLKRQHRELETAYRQRAFDLAKQQLDWASIEPAFIELYMQTYSEQELLELSAFYRTETGKKYLKHMPATLRQTSAIVQQQMQNINQQFSQIVTELATATGIEATTEHQHQH